MTKRAFACVGRTLVHRAHDQGDFNRGRTKAIMKAGLRKQVVLLNVSAVAF